MKTTQERGGRPDDQPVAHAPVSRPRGGDSGLERAAEAVRERVAEVKPHLRGWLHAATTPLALAAGIVLIVLSPTATTRVGSSLFAATALLLFAVSAIYHRGTWGPGSYAFLRRFDHANIFLLIAGSYTPFTLILLEGTDRVVMLSVVWAGALLGAFFQIAWPTAPRWLSTPIYIALGWAAIFYAPDFVSGGAAVTTLVVVGGGLYTLGGIVYGLKKPDPFPTWFGFHEVFHTLTIAAFVCHYVAASLATYSLR
ncbi:DNA-binding protein [Marmoricola endophyticus]|uniref:DNA-binding protein n=1 Tax=Marmoricola endophyticus TaxID=2040280 RepID=A0A917F8X1_9ACTN|nr:hemolysin III family protein [Marmoricola endophyticus]GGF54185.1 DNA-binding protein [Marmoricola endophyticus]